MWNEPAVAHILARNTFEGAVVALPNCTWTGYETDLLVVPKCLRVVDVEIKLSKDDLKADGKKDKWWHCHVWNDRLINVGGFAASGMPFAASSLPLAQDDDVFAANSYHAEWMPYQKGQAAKTEALESSLAVATKMGDSLLRGGSLQDAVKEALKD